MDPGQATALADHLQAANDARASLLSGAMALKGVGRLADTDEALVFFKRGCAANPGAVSCLFLGKRLLQQSRTQEATTVLKATAAQTSDAEIRWNTQLRLLLGETLQGAGLNAEAQAVARTVLAADAENAAALKLLTP